MGVTAEDDASRQALPIFADGEAKTSGLKKRNPDGMNHRG